MNTATSMATTHPQCPFCGYQFCDHFIGWTDDGRRIELRGLRGGAKTGTVAPADRLLTVGVSARVYRPS